MRSKMGVFAFFLCLIVVLTISCRRNQPSLVDANKPPETELWNAPPDSSEHEYLVHMYWRGIDEDGTVVRYIWTITDTIVPGELGWDPEERLRDYRAGRITTRTDSVFSFSAYTSTGGGIGLRKKRQAFHIAAIDDNGTIDPDPARIEFVATIDELPEIKFRVWYEEIIATCSTPSNLRKEWREIKYRPSAPPTVGMFRPFKIVYQGFTQNGQVLEYKWFPMSSVIELENAGIWSTDVGDTVRDFPNVGDLALPTGTFRFAAQCRDEASAESTVDAGQYRQGVCQILVNFDPVTEIFEALNSYVVSGSSYVETIDFEDSQPDTVPYGSWLTLFYTGSNDSIATLQCPGPVQVSIPRDSSLCEDDTNQCIRYQVSYHQWDDRFPRYESREPWTPPGGEDNNRFGVSDSTSLNMGTIHYEIMVRSIDEYGKEDRSPDTLKVVGNFSPTLDSVYIMDHVGNKIYDGDTLTWDWWTVEPVLNVYTLNWEKKFRWSINAFGHDNAKENEAGVKAWRYLFYDMNGVFEKFKNAGSWVAGPTVNVLNEVIEVTFSYPLADVDGDSVFAQLPRRWPWLNKTHDFFLKGRDTEINEEFRQYMFVQGNKALINSYYTDLCGRWTAEESMRFHFRLIRP